MQITVNSVETSFTKTAKGGYSTAVVSYVNERGENKSWKLISFANPKVYDILKAAQSGETYEIVTRKNDKDFTEWASAEKLAANAATPSAGTAAIKAPAVSQYETRDERNARQRLIVRQSCLKEANEYYKHPTLAGANVTEIDVTRVADIFVAWVFEAPDLFEQADDIPY